MQPREGVRAWDVAVALCATGAAFYAPLAVLLARLPARALAAEIVLTAVFTGDAVVRWRRRPRETVRGRTAGRRWAWTWLALDLVAAVPVALLLGRPLFHLLRLIKLSRVVDLHHVIRLRAISRAAVLRLIFFGYWLLLLTHGLACGWIGLRGDLGAVGWSSYFSGLYWCVTTLSTVGYGDVVPDTIAQRLYAMAVMMLGVGVYGFVIGNVASIVTHLDPGRTSHLRQMEEISAFMANHDIPPALRRRIGDYYRFIWRERLHYDEAEVLARLPPNLRTEVSLHLKRDLLLAVPMLREAGPDFLREIALEMRPVVYLPGDAVVRAGERGREMFFVSRGRLEVLSAKDATTVLATLAAGDFFGESALLHERPRNATVRAVEYTELYRLGADLFARVMASYPEVAEQIRATARARGAG